VGETIVVSGEPCADPISGAGASDWHPVGSNVAITPAAIVAAVLKVLLRFAFIGRAFQLPSIRYQAWTHSRFVVAMTTNGCYRLYWPREAVYSI
jgi:hypothetical protein